MPSKPSIDQTDQSPRDAQQGRWNPLKAEGQPHPLSQRISRERQTVSRSWP
jgi:hypothetical protein